MATQQTLYRFYRSNLASIVWDPENNAPLAEFIKGQFYTEDSTVANKLIALGYPQVSLDAETPPQILFEKGKSLETGEHRPILPAGMTEEVALAQEKKKAEQQRLAAKAKGLSTQADGGEDTKPNVTQAANTASDAPGAADSMENASPASLVQQAMKQASKQTKSTRKIKRRKKK